MNYRTYLYVYTNPHGTQLAAIAKPAENEADAKAIATILRAPAQAAAVTIYEIEPAMVGSVPVGNQTLPATAGGAHRPINEDDDVGDGTGDGNVEPMQPAQPAPAPQPANPATARHTLAAAG